MTPAPTKSLETTKTLLERLNEISDSFTIKQLRAFCAIVDKGESATQDEIGDYLGASQSIVSAYIQRLVDMKLVTKEPISGDQRQKAYYLTNSGRTLAHLIQTLMKV